MQHIYCTECGSKVSYSGAKPKFCSSCGSPIGSIASGQIKKKDTHRNEARVTQNLNSQPLADDETDIDYVPKIRGLDYDIAQEGSGNKVYKFGDIVNVEQKPKNKE